MFTTKLPPGICLAASLAASLAAGSVAAAQGPDVWMKLYNEVDLKGWRGKAANWKVDTGKAVTAHGSTATNTFLVTDSAFADFHFKCEGRMPNGGGGNNSGLIYRGRIANATNYTMNGYQYEISTGGVGAFYHELGDEMPFTRIAGCYGGGVDDFVKMEIIADGPKVAHLVAGAKCFEKADMKVLAKGQFGLQLHSPGNYTASFRNIFVKPLNGSFQVPADNAWDADGKRIAVVGAAIGPRRARPAPLLAAPARGWDLWGRAAQGRRSAGLLIARP